MRGSVHFGEKMAPRLSELSESRLVCLVVPKKKNAKKTAEIALGVFSQYLKLSWIRKLIMLFSYIISPRQHAVRVPTYQN